MDINSYYISDNEKPLDKIVSDGGFCGIFRSIAFIGDSLSSGEFQTVDEDGNNHYYDLYEYSWGQYIARMTGCKAYNFSKGGMSAREYWNFFADYCGFWGRDKAAQAYVIALGVNDLFGQKQELGTPCDYLEDKDTFACYYGKIVQKLKTISPDAKFFFMTMPREDAEPGGAEGEEIKKKHSALLHEMTKIFDNSYVIDFNKYAPVYDKKFKDNFYFNGHMNAAGYLLTAKMAASYIDYIIRSNPKDFTAAGLIGSGIDPHI